MRIQLSLPDLYLWSEGPGEPWCCASREITGAYTGTSAAEALGNYILATHSGLRESVQVAVRPVNGTPALEPLKSWVGSAGVPKWVVDWMHGVV